jgi:hypothetical protein
LYLNSTGACGGSWLEYFFFFILLFSILFLVFLFPGNGFIGEIDFQGRACYPSLKIAFLTAREVGSDTAPTSKNTFLFALETPLLFFSSASNDIRWCALSFMTYGEHEYVPAAAAAMMVRALSLPKQTGTYLIFSINTLIFMIVFVLLGI